MTSLARLADDTGGRFTQRTNALALGVERARDDLACRYTLALRIDAAERGRIRNVVVRVKRDGLRAIHPSKWRARTDVDRRRSTLNAAWHAPHEFDTGLVRAHLFPLAPEGRKRWLTALTVRFPVTLPSGRVSSATREFGVTVTEGTKVVHRVARSVTLRATDVDEDAAPAVAFVDRVSLPAGRYTIRAVVADPAGDTPWTSFTTVELPEIPGSSVFLVDPLLGLPFEADVAIVLAGESADDDRAGEGFVPLLVSRLDAPADVTAVTRACVSGRARRGRSIEVERVLRRGDAVVGSLPPVEPAFEGSGPVRCATLLDVLPASSLAPGQYEFDVSLASGEGDGRRTVRFSIADPVDKRPH